MKKLIKEQIIKLHSMAIKQSGGMNGVRDDGLLDLALNSPFQTFENAELYPSIQSKAAHLCFSLISNHPFIDGNKRIGILAMLVFLDVNQIMIDCSDEDVIDLGLGVASGKYKTDYIMTWIINHSSN
jgi:death-on-curing protein